MKEVLNQPLVSIIIPTYNNTGIIEKCLGSLAAQIYPNIEIIANDGNKNGPSTDGTVEKIKKFPNIKLIYENRGMAQARNAGNKKANGYFVFHIDTDMELEPDLVAKCVRLAIEKNYDALIVPEKSVAYNFWGRCRALEKETILGDPDREAANRFMKKEVFDRVGGMDEKLTAGEDFDLSLRIKNLGYKIGRVEGFILHHELSQFRKQLKKMFWYGETFVGYLKKNSLTASKQYNFFKPFYLRNWKILINDPIHAVGLFIMKVLIYTVAILGLTSQLIKEILPEKYSDDIERRMTGRLYKSIDFLGNVTSQKILDIGCSIGWLEAKIVDKCLQICCIEPDESKFNEAKNKIFKAEFKAGSVLDIPYPNSYFDKVAMFEVIEHLPENTEERALKEINRVLKSSGELIISTVNNNFFTNILDPAWYLGHRHYLREQLIKLLDKEDFSIIKIEIKGSFYELFSMILYYFFTHIFGREIPAKAWFDRKRYDEYMHDGKGIVNIFIKARKNNSKI